MKIGDLVKYNNEWSAIHGIVGVVVGFGTRRLMVSVLGTCGRVFEFGVNNLEAICK